MLPKLFPMTKDICDNLTYWLLMTAGVLNCINLSLMLYSSYYPRTIKIKFIPGQENVFRLNTLFPVLVHVIEDKQNSSKPT